MFALKDEHGNWATGKTGARFVYHSRDLARTAAKILSKAHGVKYRVIPA